MKRIIVTGGAGFIGSHVAERFHIHGYETLIIDNLSSGSKTNIPSASHFEELDLSSTKISSLIRTFKPDAIYHYAAQIDVRKSVQDPVFDANENIINTLRLVELGRSYGMQYFAFASSGGAIYGEASNGPQSESYPEQPVSPYGVAKLSVDKYLASLHHQHALKSCSMRFSNVYGPRQGSRGEAGVVSIFIKNARHGKPIIINGSGTQTRDFVYVEDLADAAVLTLQRQPLGVINFGTGLETTIHTLAHQIVNLCGKQGGVTHAEGIQGEQVRSVLNSSRAKSLLNWTPKTDLASGLKKTVDWFYNN